MVERRLGELAAAFYTRQLPEEYKRFDNPHIYKVGLSDRLKRERDTLMTKHQEEAA